MKFFFLIVLAGFFTCAGSALAQKELPPKHVRFLALGGKMVWKGKVNEEGIIIGKPPKPGSLPPIPLFLKSGDQIDLLSMRRDTLTPLMRLDPEQAGFSLLKEKKPDAVPWFQGKAPAAPFSLAIFFRDPKPPQTWFKPKMLMLPDDAASFPAGNLRLTNVSDHMMVFRIGGKKGKFYGVKPGYNSIKPIKTGVNQIEIAFEVQGVKGPISVFKNNLRVQAGQRLQLVCYKGDGKGVQNAVKCFYFPEPLPKAPTKPKKKK